MSRFKEIRDQVRKDFPTIPWVDYSLRPLSYEESDGLSIDVGKSAIVATSMDGNSSTVCGIADPNYFKVHYPEVVLHDSLSQLSDLGFGVPSISGNIKDAHFRFQFVFSSDVAVTRGDVVSPMLVAKGAQTGKNSVKLIPGALQLVCTNGLIAPVMGSMFRVIHQQNHQQGDLLIAVNAVRHYLEVEFKKQILWWRSLSHRSITFDEIQEFFDMPGFPLGGTESRGALKTILGLMMPQNNLSLNQLLAQEAATAWNLHNAVTQYSSHLTKTIQTLNKQEQLIAGAFKTYFTEE